MMLRIIQQVSFGRADFFDDDFARFQVDEVGDAVFVGGNIFHCPVWHGHPEHCPGQRIAGFGIHLFDGQAGFLAVGQHNGGRLSGNQFHIVNSIVQDVPLRVADFLNLIPIFLQPFQQGGSVLAGGDFGVLAAAAPRYPNDRPFQRFAGVYINFPDQ